MTDPGAARRTEADAFRARLASSSMTYTDGAVQTFSADGTTVYGEGGSRTDGTWSVDDQGVFHSFWPPTFRAGYDLEWIVEEGERIGLGFHDRQGGSRFEGRFAADR